MTIDQCPTWRLEQLLAALELDPDTCDNQSASIGHLTGPARPEWGPHIYDLRCCCCDATWTGIPGDPCWWCQRARQIQQEHQADLLLTPPDVDPDDITYEQRMLAWADRMAVGVTAGIIEADQADTVWKRAVRKAS